MEKIISQKLKTNKKVAVAMSGGIDSAVSAILLVRQGYDVIGLTGIMHEKMIEEAKSASELCAFLKIEHYTVDLRKEFSDTVINYFENSYKEGLTPNPCIFCNKTIKWGSLAEYAFNNLNADLYATGHYAEIIEQNGIFKLYKGVDSFKDQSYVLFALTQNQLSKTLFPLGKMKKDEIRKIALENNLTVAHKKESQDVCFICPPETTQSYLIDKFGENEGEIIDFETQKVIGKHKGAYNYTIGQRKGICVAASEPLYVISVEPKENKIFVGFKNLLSAQEFNVTDINWQQNEYQNKDRFESMVKIRYNSAAQAAEVVKTGENSVHVKFTEPKFAITSGQSAVFYDLKNEYVLLGGTVAY